MPGDEKLIPKSVIDSLQASGFPFQTAVAQLIRNSKGWKVHTTEFPWRGPKDDDRFLDIIATNKQFVITVECKKTRQDTLTFLLPVGKELYSGVTSEFRCLSCRSYTAGAHLGDVVCETRALFPESPSCEFCIVSANRSERMLEKDASLVIRATEALVQNIHEMSQLLNKLSLPFLLLPVIVTTAPLFTAHYVPSDVSPETGEFTATPKGIEKRQWVRFAKTFTTSKRHDLSYRSVFVVSASYFNEFLNSLELWPQQPDDTMPVPFYKGLP